MVPKEKALIRAVRVLQKKYIARKSGLPKRFDDCMAYFTGYRATTVRIDTPEAYLRLAHQCASYCRKFKDVESLQLLMYSVIRNVARSHELTSPFSDIATLSRLIDWVIGDIFGFYSDNLALKTQDATRLFHALLMAIKKEGKSERLFLRPFQLEDKTLNAKRMVKPKKPVERWHQKFKQEMRGYSDVTFSRGGGLYHFLDLKKGLIAPDPDDSVSLRGVYVSTDPHTDRDSFYALRPGGSRRFFDKPSIQRGKIKASLLKSTNDNCYEALIEKMHMSDVSALTIEVLPSPYQTSNFFIIDREQITEIKKQYFDKPDSEFIKRLDTLFALSKTPKESRAAYVTEMLAKR